jgi:hypothetical protein
MISQPERNKSRLFLLILVIMVFFLAANCMLGELFMMQYNQDRTATSFAVDTVWAMTYTEEARLYNYKTATAWQATEDAKRATAKADFLTFDAQMRNLTETAQAPKPPTITGINFPKEIPGNKSTIIGLLYFTDEDGDIRYVTYDVISAEHFGGGTDDSPNLDSGTWENGAIKIYLWCEGQQVVTLQATLYDWAGNRSNSMSFTFTCK